LFLGLAILGQAITIVTLAGIALTNVNGRDDLKRTGLDGVVVDVANQLSTISDDLVETVTEGRAGIGLFTTEVVAADQDVVEFVSDITFDVGSPVTSSVELGALAVVGFGIADLDGGSRAKASPVSDDALSDVLVGVQALGDGGSVEAHLGQLPGPAVLVLAGFVPAAQVAAGGVLFEPEGAFRGVDAGLIVGSANDARIGLFEVVISKIHTA